jgi:hypothetical protein
MSLRTSRLALGAAVAALLVVACSAASEDPSSTSGATEDALSLGLGTLPVPLSPPIAGIFQQQVDHPTSGTSALGTFAQRYWYSTQYASGPDAPVLFYIEGEAEADPDDASDIADSAKTLGAAIVVLEHRYYGQSNPFPQKTLANMQYLTIHEALEDLATFETWAKTNLPLAGKWIAVGGSYAGTLSAFYRETHPELVVGAWASSAPVDITKAFWGYDKIVATALGPSCTKLFQTALADATTAYADPTQRAALSTALFGGDWGPGDLAGFLDAISSIPEWDAQYGSQKYFCQPLEANPTNPLEGVILAYNPPSDDGGVDGGSGSDAGVRATRAGGTVTSHSTQHHAMQRLVKPAVQDDFTGSEWFYQVCTEVGFYQIYNPDRAVSVMSTFMDSAYYDAECEQFVGRTPDAATAKATYFAPIKAGKVSNVLFVSGTLDPWSQLTFDHPSAPPAGCATFAVENGSHCEDLYPLSKYSTSGDIGAHKKFWSLAKEWLAS